LKDRPSGHIRLSTITEQRLPRRRLADGGLAKLKTL